MTGGAFCGNHLALDSVHHLEQKENIGWPVQGFGGMASDVDRAELAALRRQVEALERGGRAVAPVLPFGVPAIDRALPGGGLAVGALHELGGAGPDEEDGAAATGFLAGILARLAPARPVLWCLAAGDLHAPPCWSRSGKLL